MPDRSDPSSATTRRPVGPPVDGDAATGARGAPADARRSGVAASLASAGHWVGQQGEGRRWEDLLSEFLAAILTWAGIGWLVDRWLDTAPWFLIAGAVLGNALGIYLMWLRSDPARSGAARPRVGDDPPAPSRPDEPGRST